MEYRVISLCAHNLSPTATIRVRGYTDNGFNTPVPEADTGIIPVWPYGFDGQNVADYPKNWTHCFSAAPVASCWLWEIDDAFNPSGFIEVGRVTPSFTAAPGMLTISIPKEQIATITSNGTLVITDDITGATLILKIKLYPTTTRTE